jgi:hypothetical protein
MVVAAAAAMHKRVRTSVVAITARAADADRNFFLGTTEQKSGKTVNSDAALHSTKLQMIHTQNEMKIKPHSPRDLSSPPACPMTSSQ